MDEDMISPVELNSFAYLNKKRKSQAELLDTPLPKHACWDQKLEYESSSDLPKKVSNSIFASGVESAPESIIHSHSFHGDTDSSMSTYNHTKTHASVEPSTSTTIWDDNSSQIGLYSIEKRPTTKESSKKSESTFISDYGLLSSDIYEDHLLEYGSHGDCGFSEYDFSGVEDCTNTDLDVLLDSNRADANSQEKAKKLTIDKEFEEYFSMLML